MRTFERTSLPEYINYNGKVYTRECNVTGIEYIDTHEDVNRLKSEGKMIVLVNVLSRNLRNRLNLHNQPYKPTQWLYSSK